MAYTPCYPNKINWQNEPSEATAINNVNLNKMDSAIYTIDERVVDMSTRLDSDDTAITNLQGNVSDLQGDMTTAQGNITTLQNGKVDKETGKGLSQVDNVTVTQHVAYGTVVSTIKTYKQDGTEVTSQVCNGIVVDSALSNSSTNPVQNKVVKSAIDEKSTVAISDTLETGTTLANITIDGTTTAIKGSDIEVDEELSPTSANPVENKAIYDALNNLLPSKTVIGNPIAISDASGFNAKALKVIMNPIQDLHGYDHPWPGGAGKNKFQTTATSQTINGTVFTVNADGSVKIKNTPSSTIAQFNFGTISLNAGTYRANGFSGGASNNIRLVYFDDTHNVVIAVIYQNYDIAFTLSETSNIRVYPIIPTQYDGAEVTMYPMIRLATETDATFAPYSNICPISGRTEVSVTRTGVNQWDEQWESGSINNTTGENQNAGTNRIRSKNYISVFPQTSYYFYNSSGVNCFIYYYDANKTFLGMEPGGSGLANVTFTTPANCYFVRFRSNDNYGTTYNNNISVNYPSTDTNYHAYTAETHTKEFGQTVIGGRLDFVNGGATSEQGKLVLDGTENWTADTGRNGVYYLFNTMALSTYADCVCDIFKTIHSNAEMQSLGIAFGVQNKAIYIPRLFDGAISGVTDVASWKTYLSNNNMEITYPLGTPTTIQLSPEAVTLLKGNNILSTNADDMELKYSVSLDSLLS